VLLEQRGEERAQPASEGAGFVLVTERALTEYNHNIARIDRQLAVIERDIGAINAHLPSVSDDGFQQAVQRYRQEFREIFNRVIGLAMARKQAESALRRKG
jgi:hypothetical protein